MAGKTSVVIVATTRSGQGVTTPHGNITTFLRLVWNVRCGSRSRLRRSKVGKLYLCRRAEQRPFLDPPEFVVMHDKGNEENAFDRVDYQLSTR